MNKEEIIIKIGGTIAYYQDDARTIEEALSLPEKIYDLMDEYNR